MIEESSLEEKTRFAAQLRGETDEEVEERFWALSHLQWNRPQDAALIKYLKDELVHNFIKETGLGSDRSPVVRRHIHIGEGEDQYGEYVCATFSFTGNTYFFYEDSSDRASLDEWINQTAWTMSRDYQTERNNYGFTELEDGGGW